MNAILLAGMSLRNRDWLHELANSIKPLFGKTIRQIYDHWSTGEEMDLEFEQEGVAVMKKELGENYAVVAKSAGAVLSLKAIDAGVISPKYCVFMGTALGYAEEKKLDLSKWLKSLKCPTLFIQNNGDPVGSFGKLQHFVEQSGFSQAKFVEWPGDTHEYNDFDKLMRLIQEFIK